MCNTVQQKSNRTIFLLRHLTEVSQFVNVFKFLPTFIQINTYAFVSSSVYLIFSLISHTGRIFFLITPLFPIQPIVDLFLIVVVLVTVLCRIKVWRRAGYLDLTVVRMDYIFCHILKQFFSAFQKPRLLLTIYASYCFKILFSLVHIACCIFPWVLNPSFHKQIPTGLVVKKLKVIRLLLTNPIVIMRGSGSQIQMFLIFKGCHAKHYQKRD